MIKRKSFVAWTFGLMALAACAHRSAETFDPSTDSAWYNDPLPKCTTVIAGTFCNAAGQKVTAAHANDAPTVVPSPQTTAPDTSYTPEYQAPPPLPWWRQIPERSDEVFAGANDSGAVWVTNRYRTSANGTRIAFLHYEFAVPAAPFYHLSESTVKEIDCEAGKSRVVESYAYSDRLLGGQLLHHDSDVLEWTYIQPGSMIDAVSKQVCSKPSPGAHTAPDRQKANSKPKTKPQPTKQPAYI